VTFRTRLLLAFAGSALVPLVFLTAGVRSMVRSRLSAAAERRTTALASVMEHDLQDRGGLVATRLRALGAAITADNRLRAAIIQGSPSDREYLLDYAERAMPLAGLGMLQIEDQNGRILSSGHFRNEHGLVAAHWTLPQQNESGLLVARVRSPAGAFLVLARLDSVRLGERWLRLVGGERLDDALLTSWPTSDELLISLVAPDTLLSSQPVTHPAASSASIGSDSNRRVVRQISLPYVRGTGAERASIGEARFTITRSLAADRALRSQIDWWFLIVSGGAVCSALLVAFWMAGRLVGPVEELAAKAASLDLERLEVGFDAERRDEIGELARALGDMSARLRISSRRLQAAERRATLGELARQVNHDVKNGLIPIRNVVRHLGCVRREDPEQLPVVFADREQTLVSSIAYLERLAAHYARLSPVADAGPCDLAAVIAEVAAAARNITAVEVSTEIEPVPLVGAGSVALRRILENLVSNALDSLGSGSGRIRLTLRAVQSTPPVVCLMVSDTGMGMDAEGLARAFNDFYTSKSEGIGLGLSVVRRLVLDMNGDVRIESTPGVGTTVVLHLPVAVLTSTLPPEAGRLAS